LIQFGQDFHDELLKYNNSKLLLPNLCGNFFQNDYSFFHFYIEWQENKDYSFAKFPGETILSQLSVSLYSVALEETIPVFAILTDYRVFTLLLSWSISYFGSFCFSQWTRIT